MEGGCRRRDPCWVERKRHIREGRVARSSLCRGSFIRGLAGAQLELFLGLGILREAIRYGDKEPPRGSAPHPANRGAAVLAGKQKAASIVVQTCKPTTRLTAEAREGNHLSMPPPEKPLPLPKPKPPKPKPKPKTGPELKPRAARPQPQPEPEWDVTAAGVPTLPDAFSCAENCSESCAHYHFCPLAPPPPSPAATLHLRSSRLPTPLIALSASLLAISAVLLLALLVHRLVRRRRRRRRAQNAPPLAQHDEERGAVLAAVAEGAGEEEEDEDVDGGVHHVWYIRTKGLDERAIAAIAAVVYDAKKRGAPGGGGDGSCAVCLAEFRDGETLRLLPRCGHAFHRGCIDTWLRAHVNCPLCRAPVQVAAAAKANAAASGEDAAILGAAGGAQTQDAERGGLPESAVRRAASMVALPRRAWPDVSLRAPASNSAREEEMTGLGKIRRLLKFSEALEMAGVGVGRSISFGGAGSCQRLPARTGPSAAAGVSGDEMETSQ